MNKLNENEAINYWQSVLGVANSDITKKHLERFFNITIAKMVQSVNEERKLISKREETSKDKFINNEEYDFFEKEFKYLNDSLENLLEKYNFILDKLSMRTSLLKQFEKMTDSEFSHFIIDEARLFYEDEKNGTNVISTSEDPLSYFVKKRFHTKGYRLECETYYPHFFELINENINRFLSYIKEVLDNVSFDFNEIKDVYFKKYNNIILEDISLGDGDRHKKGKSVAALKFSKGKIFYKPRNGDLDVAFFRLLSKLSRFNLNYEFRDLVILNRRDHSYFEEVPYVQTKNNAEFREYYEKLGCLLGILYTLNGTDFHNENIIACGNNPMLIDLESLFHSNIFINENIYDKGFYDLLKQSDPSVIDIGILPKKIVKNFNNEDISLEIGGIGGEEVKASPFKYSKLNIQNSEIIHSRDFGLNQVNQNNPVSKFSDKDYEIINECLKKGFILFYQTVLQNREEYLSTIEKLFGNLEIRVILRPTYIYSKLLSLSKNIYIIGSEANRDVLFSKLAYERWDQLDFVKSEYNQLKQNDIPFFVSNTSSLDISDYENNYLGKLSDSTPLNNALNKIKKMTSDDLTNQVSLIDQAINLKRYKDVSTGIEFAKKEKDLNLQSMLSTAEGIGEMIVNRAVECSEDTITWVSTVLQGKEEVEFGIGPVGNDLYLGNAGISLYLTYLYKKTNNKEFYVAVQKANNYNIEFLKQEKLYEHGNVGYYNGSSGIIISLAVSNLHIPIPNFNDVVTVSLERMRRLFDECQSFDILTGTAGLISSMLCLEKLYPGKYTNQVKELLLLSYNHLFRNAVIDGDIAYWKTSNTKAYTGYAHGNAGIISALSCLAEVEEELFGFKLVDRNFASKILTYIDNNFDKQQGLWETIPGTNRYSKGWCHGPQGQLIAQTNVKLGLPELSKNDEFFKDIIEKIKNVGFGNNSTICHGDLGSLKAIEYYAKKMKDKKLLLDCKEVFGSIYNDVLSVNWKGNIISNTESLGLMLGVAGWGYEILQHIDYDEMFDFFDV